MEIPDDLANALEGELYRLMARREINNNGPDETVCDFCQNHARDAKGGKQQDVKHDDDCIGVRLQHEFDKRL